MYFSKKGIDTDETKADLDVDDRIDPLPWHALLSTAGGFRLPRWRNVHPPTFFITDLDSFKEAVAKIQTLRDESGLTEATLVFTQNLEFDYVSHADVDKSYNSNYDTQFVGKNYFSGIEGVTLTLTSESDPVTLKTWAPRWVLSASPTRASIPTTKTPISLPDRWC